MREISIKLVKKNPVPVWLGTSLLLATALDTKTEGPGVSIWPWNLNMPTSRIYDFKGKQTNLWSCNVISRTD